MEETTYDCHECGRTLRENDTVYVLEGDICCSYDCIMEVARIATTTTTLKDVLEW